MPGLENEQRLTVEKGLLLDPLTAISPIDGRYSEQTEGWRGYFSEYALVRGRVYVEIKYLQALSQRRVVRPFQPQELVALDSVWQRFGISDARRVKETERTTRQDVKAMEYYLKKRLSGMEMDDVLEMVHFGLTSEDVTNLSQNLYITPPKMNYLFRLPGL